jgi:hypothetical protein
MAAFPSFLVVVKEVKVVVVTIITELVLKEDLCVEMVRSPCMILNP